MDKREPIAKETQMSSISKNSPGDSNKPENLMESLDAMFSFPPLSEEQPVDRFVAARGIPKSKPRTVKSAISKAKSPEPVEPISAKCGAVEVTAVRASQVEEDIVDILEDMDDDFIFLTGKGGTGKCLAEGTRVIMFDGSVRNVEDVNVGDALMGPDSKPRMVLAVHLGEEELYSVKPISSQPFVCTGNHILALTGTDQMRGQYRLATVNELIEQSKFVRADRKWKLYQVGVEFEEQETDLDPYVAGVWLADGSRGGPVVTTSQGEVIDALRKEASRLNQRLVLRYVEKKHSITTRVTGDVQGNTGRCRNVFLELTRKLLDSKRRKFIPKEYLINSREKRLHLLAGLLDCDGYYNNGGIEIISYSPPLAEGIVFLARSLGFHVHSSEKVVKGYEHNEYARIYITGNVCEIPFRTIVAEKRRQIKRHNVSGFDIESAGVGRYVGFEVDGDNLFLLSDFTVTHNSASVRRFVKSTRKRVLICAPTGVAAVNCGGMTIHKMFRLPIKPLDESDIREIAQRQSKATKVADVLIIDEISMVSAPLLDSLDRVLRACRRRHDKPFGGIQVIACGDCHQLPSIVRDDEWELYKGKYASRHFFSAPVFKKHPLKIVALTRMFRQKESERDFLDILNGVRRGKLTQELLDKLNSRFRPDFTVQPGYVVLCPRNDMVDSINRKELSKIHEPETEYLASLTGTFDPKNCLADQVLTLKPGAQVMFLRNDAGGRYVNGTLGTVKSCDPDNLIVSVDGSPISVEQEVWEEAKYEVQKRDGVDVIEQDIIGSMTQYPVKLSFAISIHKSQGKTYPKCVVDPRGIFENGQLYVSLSRCTTLSGLILKNQVSRSDIRVDPVVLKWTDDMITEGNFRAVYQKFIEGTSELPKEPQSNNAEFDLVIAKIAAGSFPSDSELHEIKALSQGMISEISAKCGAVFLDEIEMLRSEIHKVKKDNAVLKGKLTRAETSKAVKPIEKPAVRSGLFERNFADMDSEPRE